MGTMHNTWLFVALTLAEEAEFVITFAVLPDVKLDDIMAWPTRSVPAWATATVTFFILMQSKAAS